MYQFLRIKSLTRGRSTNRLLLCTIDINIIYRLEAWREQKHSKVHIFLLTCATYGDIKICHAPFSRWSKLDLSGIQHTKIKILLNVDFKILINKSSYTLHRT